MNQVFYIPMNVNINVGNDFNRLQNMYIKSVVHDFTSFYEN